MDDPLAGPPRTVCTSCGELNDQRDRCSCIVSRATAVASLAYELHRASTPAWRRPRRWVDLPQRARAELVHAGLDLVEALEGHGWRLVKASRPPAGAHEFVPEAQQQPAPDPDDTGPLRVVDPGPVVPRFVEDVPAPWPYGLDDVVQRDLAAVLEREDAAVRVPPYVAGTDPGVHHAPGAVQ